MHSSVSHNVVSFFFFLKDLVNSLLTKYSFSWQFFLLSSTHIALVSDTFFDKYLLQSLQSDRLLNL